MNQMKKEELEITISDSDRIECAIRHIQTAVDVDPWAVEIAVEAMEKQIPKEPKMPLDAYWTCQICGGVVEPSHKYCKRCGQAIDWEEE